MTQKFRHPIRDIDWGEQAQYSIHRGGWNPNMTKAERRDMGLETLAESEAKYKKKKAAEMKEAERKREKEEAEQKRKDEAEARNPTPKIKDESYPVPIPYSVRDRHVYIPGKTRQGKTTVMYRMIMQDIEQGEGVTILDPKGDLAVRLLHSIPDHRVNDTIYVDLATPIPIDFMGCTPDERETLVGELKYILTKGDPSLVRADAIITRVLYTLLGVPGTNFLDIERFLADEDRKREILQYLKQSDPDRYRRWKNNFPRPDEITPILTRMTKFVENPSLAAIFGESHPRLNIAEVMDTKKILIVNLGGLAESNTIYGSLLVSKFQQEAFRRHSTDSEKRIPHFLYVDEFEAFQTLSFDKILSMAGGYGLRFTIGNQFIGQLDQRIRASIFGNVGTYIVFSIGPEDTGLFKHAAHPYDPDWLGRLQQYQAMYKVGDHAPVFKMNADMPELDKNRGARIAEIIRKRTVENYGCNTARNVFNKGDGNSSTTISDEDEIKPGGKPGDIPSHEG